MTTDQKKLLLEVANLRIAEFMLEMNDHWSSSDYAKSREYAGKIRTLEASYLNDFGDLPEWKYIDDVIACRDNLKKELTEASR